MDASTFIGRVGGLAVALGVGAAAFSGMAVAWADAPADSTSVGSPASSDSPVAARPARVSPSAPRSASRPANRSVANSSPAGAGVPSRVKAALPSVPHTTDPVSAALDNLAASADAPAAAAVPSVAAVAGRAAAVIDPVSATVELVAAPETASASGVLTAVADPVSDPAANGNPAVPAESPITWTVMEYTRRSSAVTRTAAAVPAAAATQPLVLGPSGVPIPSDYYVDTVMNYYILPNSPGGAETPQVVFTPEGLYPITGVKSLPLNTSVNQGLTILSDTMKLLPPHTPTTVFGYSQSAIIGSLMQSGYNDTPVPTDLQDSTNFVFVGNEMNPNGGFLSRFPGLTLASLGIPFYGPTPSDAYPTTNYALEYDGFADFPRYPMNFLADLNAGLGIVFVHTKYTPGPNCTSFCTTLQQVEDAIALPSSDPTQRYFFMPTENLPLVEPLRLIPFIGNPIADLIQPVLKVIVDLGYADPAHGFTSATQPNANELVTFGVFPEVNPLEVLTKLADGVKQGISDFFNDFGPTGSIAKELSALTMPTLAASSSGDSVITQIQNAISGVANRISAGIASLYAGLLPTADIVNALAITLPAYDVNLVLTGIQQMISGDILGGLVNAIGLPIAADVGLATTAGLVGVLVWGEAIAGLFGVPVSA